MAEWSKAAVLKTASPKGLVGSNPTPSATHHGEMAELAEGARLLSEYGVKSSIEGSNPSLSAIYFTGLALFIFSIQYWLVMLIKYH
jgi:hypothetical protein